MRRLYFYDCPTCGRRSHLDDVPECRRCHQRLCPDCVPELNWALEVCPAHLDAEVYAIQSQRDKLMSFAKDMVTLIGVLSIAPALGKELHG